MERCSEKVADFVKAVFLQVDGRQNDHKASLKICKVWMAAMLNAEVARQAKECTDPKLKELLKPFEEGFLNFNFDKIAQLTKSVSTHRRCSWGEHRMVDSLTSTSTFGFMLGWGA